MTLTPPVLDGTSIRRLKRHLATWFPGIGPSQRLELAARGLGYRTYASLVSDLKIGPVRVGCLDIGPAMEFAGRVGLGVHPDDARDALNEFLQRDFRSPANTEQTGTRRKGSAAPKS